MIQYWTSFSTSRLLIRDKLAKWAVVVDQRCLLCNTEDESIYHMFFECKVTAIIWNKLLSWQGIHRQVCQWQEEINWAMVNARGKSTTITGYRMALVRCIYHMWEVRNHRCFQKAQRDTGVIIRQLIQELFHRGSSKPKLARRFKQLNFYP